MQYFYSVNFKKYKYNNRKEKSKHKQIMLDEGWKVDEEYGMIIQYRKSEMEE